MYDLKVTDVISLMDREQGGSQNIKDNNINFLSVIKANELLKYLVSKEKITQEKMDEIMDFLHSHSFQASSANIA